MQWTSKYHECSWNIIVPRRLINIELTLDAKYWIQQNIGYTTMCTRKLQQYYNSLPIFQRYVGTESSPRPPPPVLCPFHPLSTPLPSSPVPSSLPTKDSRLPPPRTNPSHSRPNIWLSFYPPSRGRIPRRWISGVSEGVDVAAVDGWLFEDIPMGGRLGLTLTVSFYCW